MMSVGQRTAQANRRGVWTWLARGVGALVLVVLAASGVLVWRMSDIPAKRRGVWMWLAHVGAVGVLAACA